MIIVKTSQDHYNKYAELVKKFNVKLSSGFLGYSTNQWKELFALDEHLNNVKLHHWDMAGQFLHHKGLSMAEIVCTLKHAVIYGIIKAKPEFEK